MTAAGAPYGGYMCVGEEVVIASVGRRVVDPETTRDYRFGDAEVAQYGHAPGGSSLDQICVETISTEVHCGL
jgi:hypothetical protein